MARLMWLLGCTVWAMGLTGCVIEDVAHEQPFACDGDAACVLGFVCAEGVCVSPAPVACVGCEGDCINDVCLAICEGPADCDDGLTTCQDGQCRPPPDCGPDGACEAGLLCGPLGVCVPDPGWCGVASCGVGEVCVAEACWTECGDRRLCGVGMQCAEWGCAEPCGAGFCGQDEACVDGACADLCACPYEEHCDDGPCRCGEGPACEGGLRCIDGSCLDSCDNRCGADRCVEGRCMDGCDNSCVDDEACVGDVCKCNGLRCDADQRCLGNQCQDACGNACGPGVICDAQGLCRCGGEICDAGVACVEGRCDSPCPLGCNAFEECQFGDCLCAGLVCALDQACDAGLGCVAACQGDAACAGEAECVEGLCICGGEALDHTCDAAEICQAGECINRCDLCQPGEACENGQCQCGALACSVGEVCRGNQCMPSCGGEVCEADEVCAEDQCTTPCVDPMQCARNTWCRDGGCVPSCGGNAPCSGDEVCLAGLCQPACDGVCPEGEFCIGRGGADECVCEQVGGSCGPNGACVDGHCVEPCGAGVCAPADGCLDGQCVPRCLDDAGCGVDEWCAEGLCVACEVDWDCQEGLVCTGGRCEVLACMQDADCAVDLDGDGHSDRVCDEGRCAPLFCDEGCCDGNGVQLDQECVALVETRCEIECAAEISTLSARGRCDQLGLCIAQGAGDMPAALLCEPGSVCVELEEGVAVCAPEEAQICPPVVICGHGRQNTVCAPGARCVAAECASWACEQMTCNDWGPTVAALNGAIAAVGPGEFGDAASELRWNQAVGGPFNTRGEAHVYCEQIIGDGWRLPSWFELVTALPFEEGDVLPLPAAFAMGNRWYVTRTVLESGQVFGAQLPQVHVAPLADGVQMFALCVHSEPLALNFAGRVTQVHQTNDDPFFGLHWTSLADREQTAARAAQICAGMGPPSRLPTVQEAATLVSWNPESDPVAYANDGQPIDLLLGNPPAPVWTSQVRNGMTWVVDVSTGRIELRGDAVQAGVRTVCVRP